MIKLLKKLDLKGTIIDIGGASGTPKDKFKSWEPEKHIILDNNLEKEAKANLWVEPDVIFDLNIDNWTGETADWVICLSVFTYIYDPVKAMSTIYSMLKNGGNAVISFPFIYPHHPISKADTLRYTRAGIEILFQKAGFKNCNIVGDKTEHLKLLNEFYELEKFHKAIDIDHSEINFMAKATKE